MPVYAAPLRDYRFCLEEVFDGEAHRALPGFADFTPDVTTAALEEAAKFCQQVIFPLNRSGDEEGCVLENGVVRTPTGFKEAYALFRDGGWPALTCAPEDGGQGMPHMVNVLVEEMAGSANLSFCLYPGLTRGAYVALKRFGTPEQQALYLAKLASGEWTGSMCLTEPQAGTDLGLIRTVATPQGDGSHAVTGTKMFISAGEHDLTPNIVYLVLARLPDAPKGTRGISLFVVPKFLVGEGHRLGARNAVSCSAIEHKMGIKGSATCVMNFDGAAGWLVGEPHQGLKAMFAMMNAERIAVAVQGLAIAEASYQTAAAYARERRQGRRAGTPAEPQAAADTILVHPDVRRMLLTQRALAEGCRMLALWVAEALDISERHTLPAERARAADFVALMTPVLKAFLTDSGSEAANLGLQVLGGHGYVRDNGQEQLVRDVRVTQIYEGTNGVQAMDLLARKVLPENGRLLDTFRDEARAFAAAHRNDSRLAEFIRPLAEALDLLDRATATVLARAPGNPDEIGAAATAYLRLLALAALAYLWTRAAKLALGREGDDFYKAKLATTRFFMQRLLPETLTLHAAIMAGAAAVMELDPAAF
ncbi:MAG: acyl-CoA dehydrogenase C-terminal domain-containing protein [Rhizobiales bacterium]|nr:acyl-CoA dehydrogenase C-terminal domain-containing protein [Hyphomicrobiales bacterium]MBI3674837.1 acyl-CoA dehydrogenase C-terminal domain-containing protein [Hyphomicrobiales bacterium]